MFKNFYENLAQSLVDKLPPAPNKFNLDTTKSFYESLNILNTSKLQEVNIVSTIKMLKQTNCNKAPGIDKLLGIIFIKDGADLLAALITKSINLSISTSLSRFI